MQYLFLHISCTAAALFLSYLSASPASIVKLQRMWRKFGVVGLYQNYIEDFGAKGISKSKFIKFNAIGKG